MTFPRGPFWLFLIALAGGYFLRPSPGDAVRSRCKAVLARAGVRASVSASDHLVVVAVPSGPGLSREGVRALVSTELQPDDVLAVVTRPPGGFPFVPLAGALGALGLLVLWRRIPRSSRVMLTAPLWHRASAQAAVDALATRVATERGVLLPDLHVRVGTRWQVSIDGSEGPPPANAAGLSAALEARLVDLVGPEELGRLLAAWNSTHPITVRELKTRLALPDLLREVRLCLERGDHLRDLEGWAARRLSC